MNAELHILMACVTLSLLPIFLLYLIGQRFFVEGVTMSGIKG
jgi:multiple sugar transport system permease protein